MPRLLLRLLSAVVLAVSAIAAGAQGFPDRPVKIVVSLGPGSSIDLTTRQLASWLEAEWGKPVIVENRPGAGGIVAAQYVLRQPADGYTLLSIGPSLITNVLQNRNAGYDIERDFYPVAQYSRLRIVLASSTTIPAKTLPEFAALSRAKPGTMNFAGTGRTSIQDTGTDVIARGLGIDLTFVPYAGAPEQVAAVLRGDAQLVWGGTQVMKQQVPSGKLRILAAVAAERHPDLPDVPTVVEAGYAGFIPPVWNGLVARAGTPPAILEKINRDVNRAISRPEAGRMMEDSFGQQPTPLPHGKFRADVLEQLAFWRTKFRELGIDPE